MKDNKKGFTFVEVLAAVTLLGILSVGAVVGVNKVIQNAKKEHYVTAEEQLKLAGQSYAQQNRKALPKAIGQKQKISLEELINKNYIKQIKDYNDKDCDIEKSYVQVFKYSKSDYSYISYLECPDYDSKETIGDVSPKINIELTDHDDVKTAKAKVAITDQEKLLSWSYIIYKNGKEVKNSGSVQIPGYPKEYKKNIDLSKFTPGKVKVIVTATNIYGLTTTKTVQDYYEDKQPPTCVIADVDNKDNPKPWTKGPVTITVGCKDGNGEGCKKAEFTKTFKNTTNTGKITIVDLAGNEANCEVSVNVDVTPPEVPVIKLYKWANNKTEPTSTTDLEKYTADTWSPKRIFTKGTGSDTREEKESGLDYYQYTITGAEPNKKDVKGQNVSIKTDGISTIKYRACDKVGNCSDYSSDSKIKIDTIAPSCTSSGGSSIWTNQNVKIKGTCSDKGGSNCVSTTIEKEYKSNIDSTTETPGTVEDVAGNKTTCPANQTVKIDKTDPTCTSSGGNSSWTKNNITLVGTCKDTGGSGCKSNAKKEFTGDTNLVFQSPGTVYDNAGNSGKCPADQTVKIDKTAPICTSSGGKLTWTNKNITLKGTCYDSGSGCKSVEKPYTQDFFESYSESPGTVTDAAGNKVTCPADQVVKIDKIPPTAPTGGSIGGVSGSDKNASIQTPASGSTDQGSGLKEYLYYIKNSSSTPANSSTGFTTSKNYTRACGQTNYAFAIAVDNAGNRSSVKSLGSSKDSANSYSAWTKCSANCNGGTQTRTNSCALVTTGLSQACNTQDCCSKTHIEWNDETVESNWGECSANDGKCGAGKSWLYGRVLSDYDSRLCDDTFKSRDCEVDCCQPVSNRYTICDDWQEANGKLHRKCNEYSNYNGRWCYFYWEDYTGDTCIKKQTICKGWGCDKTTGKSSRWCDEWSTIDGKWCNGWREYGTCEKYEANNCSFRGSKKINTKYSWLCTCGSYHTQAYIHYCTDANSNFKSQFENKTLVKYSFVCPVNPYDPKYNYQIITDTSTALAHYDKG